MVDYNMPGLDGTPDGIDLGEDVGGVAAFNDGLHPMPSIGNSGSFSTGLDNMFVPSALQHDIDSFLHPEPDFAYTRNEEYEPLDLSKLHPNDWAEATKEHTATPYGYDENGVPIYNDTIACGVCAGHEGEFIAPVDHISPDGTHSVEWKNIPEAGEARDALLAEIKEQWMNEYKAWEQQRQLDNTMREIQAHNRQLEHESRMDELESEAEMKSTQRRMGEHEQASAGNMTREQMLAARDAGLTRVGTSGTTFVNDLNEPHDVDYGGHIKKL